LCRAVLERRMNSLGGTSGSQLPSEIIGLAVNLAMPAALKFTGMFWDVHGQYHIPERLVEGIGSNSGHYSLGKKKANVSGQVTRQPIHDLNPITGSLKDANSARVNDKTHRRATPL